MVREPLIICADRLRKDGVVILPQVLENDALSLAEKGFEWSLGHPTPAAIQSTEDAGGTCYEDRCHPEAANIYQELLCESPLPDILAGLWGPSSVWFLHETVCLLDGPTTRRTAWHRPSSELALRGKQIAVVRIILDATSKAHSPEFVRGSHHEANEARSAFDAAADERPSDGVDVPNEGIEKQSETRDVVAWDVMPGDVLICHPAVLQADGGCEAGVRQRTLTLHFFGEDAHYAARSIRAPLPLNSGLHDTLKDGDLFRHPAFPRLRPFPIGFEQIRAKTALHERGGLTRNLRGKSAAR